MINLKMEEMILRKKLQEIFTKKLKKKSGNLTLIWI